MMKLYPMVRVNVTDEHKIELMHIANDNYFQQDEKSSILEPSSHVRLCMIYMSTTYLGYMLNSSYERFISEYWLNKMQFTNQENLHLI